MSDETIRRWGKGNHSAGRPNRLLGCLLVGWLAGFVAMAEEVRLVPPAGLRALPRQLRVDLLWEDSGSNVSYEVQRAVKPDGPFTTLPSPLPGLTMHSDFIGTAGGDFFYRVCGLRPNESSRKILHSDWTAPVKGNPQALNAGELLTEVQEASFRYDYDFAHPVSGLVREGTGFLPDFCAIGATGMGLFNLVVGVERHFITRQQGAERVLKMLRFLAQKADRFHGAFPHFLNGRTGQVNPFFDGDDGADLVETAFLMQGILFVREYFSGANAAETEIRELANSLWRGVEWDWFAHDEAEGAALIWHWSPTRGWRNKLPITGFNECHIVYLLAMVSPTHPVSPKFYWQGWESKHFGEARTRLGIALELSHDFGPPLFWSHYSYLGLDPRQVSYHQRSYFEHFQDLCRVQVRYAESRRGDFIGYGPLWGITASNGPKGYEPFAPGERDNGTLAPTAALASMPYVPEASRACLAELYQRYGARLWGPFGFYDAFNFSRDWVSNNYLGIDVGPIAPMIENERTGFCWKTFMRSPEINRALSLVQESQRPKSGLPVGQSESSSEATKRL
jgi:exo beta-1,2-glucooligosaccharide sophorohydrolase (non-reducing end)